MAFPERRSFATLRKVDNLHTIIQKDYEGTLKTNFSIIEFYGFNPQGLFYLIQEDWRFSFGAFIIVTIIGIIITLILK